MFAARLLLILAALLLGVASVLAGQRNFLQAEHQWKGKATVNSHSIGEHDAEFFKAMAKLAEGINEQTGNLHAAVQQLRTAFLLCPTCRYDDFSGAKFREVFSIDMLPDRLYLTDSIFPAIQKMHVQHSSSSPLQVLWAGSHPYTLRYEYLLKGVQITSMDPNPDVAVYGSSYKHAVDFLQNIGKYAAPETFDIAVVNGVIGWGINSEEEIASFLKSVHKALKPGGYLIIGFNRHMISCCGFDPYFEPSPMGELPQKKDFDGHWQHTYEIFRRTSHA